MKLKTFEAEAEVLGKNRSVQFREGGLMLTGLTYEEAMEVMRLIGPKTEAPPWREDQPRSVVTPEKSSAKEVVRSSEDRAPKPAAVKSEPKPEPELKSMTVKEFAFPPDKEPNKAELKLAKELEGVKEPGSDGAEVPKKIAESTRFIDVLEWVLTTKKLKKAQVPEIVAAFTSLGLGEVPAVRRVRDLTDKVTSQLAAYDEAGDAA